MAVNRWDPFTVLARLDTEFDELVRRAWGPQGARSGSAVTAGYVPACEVTKDGTDVVIMLELPGIDVEKDVDIEVAQGRLTITGERQERRIQREGEDDQRGVLVRELRYGSFRREFALPEHVKAEDVDAGYDRGMLFVRVRNVSKPVEAPRKVTIRSASGQTAVGAGETSGEGQPEIKGSSKS
jgi:HSP20 family protein